MAENSAVNSLVDSASSLDISNSSNKPICLIVIGMAGAGKSTFIKRLNAHLHSQNTPPYVINLDPACHEVGYPCNVDIRDTVNYKEVMKQYSLGPNGAIVTSLNLFSTKFNQIIDLVEKRSAQCPYVLIDTPGQIEVFTWSASGQIITESLASAFPTVIIYLMDTSRSVQPITFMSNMLYACSILYKSKLPFIIAMNKNDIVHHSFVGEWITNFEAFQDALENESASASSAGTSSYMSNLTRSLSLVLDEFYQNINFVGVSSMTGAGMSDFMDAVKLAAIDYETNYKPEYEKFKEKMASREKQKQEEQLNRFKADLASERLMGADAVGGIAENDSGVVKKNIEIVSTIADEDEEDDKSKEMIPDLDGEEGQSEMESFKRFLSQQQKKKVADQ